jgi:hypothetical protein
VRGRQPLWGAGPCQPGVRTFFRAFRLKYSHNAESFQSSRKLPPQRYVLPIMVKQGGGRVVNLIGNDVVKPSCWEICPGATAGQILTLPLAGPIRQARDQLRCGQSGTGAHRALGGSGRCDGAGHEKPLLLILALVNTSITTGPLPAAASKSGVALSFDVAIGVIFNPASRSAP